MWTSSRRQGRGSNRHDDRHRLDSRVEPRVTDTQDVYNRDRQGRNCWNAGDRDRDKPDDQYNDTWRSADQQDDLSKDQRNRDYLDASYNDPRYVDTGDSAYVRDGGLDYSAGDHYLQDDRKETYSDTRRVYDSSYRDDLGVSDEYAKNNATYDDRGPHPENRFYDNGDRSQDDREYNRDKILDVNREREYFNERSLDAGYHDNRSLDAGYRHDNVGRVEYDLSRVEQHQYQSSTDVRLDNQNWQVDSQGERHRADQSKGQQSKNNFQKGHYSDRSRDSLSEGKMNRRPDAVSGLRQTESNTSSRDLRGKLSSGHSQRSDRSGNGLRKAASPIRQRASDRRRDEDNKGRPSSRKSADGGGRSHSGSAHASKGTGKIQTDKKNTNTSASSVRTPRVSRFSESSAKVDNIKKEINTPVRQSSRSGLSDKIPVKIESNAYPEEDILSIFADDDRFNAETKRLSDRDTTLGGHTDRRDSSRLDRRDRNMTQTSDSLFQIHAESSSTIFDDRNQKTDTFHNSSSSKGQTNNRSSGNVNKDRDRKLPPQKVDSVDRARTRFRQKFEMIRKKYISQRGEGRRFSRWQQGTKAPDRLQTGSNSNQRDAVSRQAFDHRPSEPGYSGTDHRSGQALRNDPRYDIVSNVQRESLDARDGYNDSYDRQISEQERGGFYNETQGRNEDVRGDSYNRNENYGGQRYLGNEGHFRQPSNMDNYRVKSRGFNNVKRKYFGKGSGLGYKRELRMYSNNSKSRFNKPDTAFRSQRDGVYEASDSRHTDAEQNVLPVQHIDPNQQLIFIPNPDYQPGQGHVVDQFGNVLLNPELGHGVHQGEQVIQIPSANLPPGAPQPPPGQEYIFIPFNQVPNVADHPSTSGGTAEPGFVDAAKPSIQEKKEVEKVKGPSQTGKVKKPLSRKQLGLIKRKIAMKRRARLEKQIEEKILEKLMSSGSLTKPKPVLTKITPPSARSPSHAGKKIKLVRKTALEEVSDDEVEEKYDNVSDLEDVTDDDEGEKRSAFRKPGEPRKLVRRRPQQGHQGGDGRDRGQASGSDIRKVVERNSSGKHRMNERKQDSERPQYQERQHSPAKKQRMQDGPRAHGSGSERDRDYRSRSISPIQITVNNDRFSKEDEYYDDEGNKSPRYTRTYNERFPETKNDRYKYVRDDKSSKKVRGSSRDRKTGSSSTSKYISDKDRSEERRQSSSSDARGFKSSDKASSKYGRGEVDDRQRKESRGSTYNQGRNSREKEKTDRGREEKRERGREGERREHSREEKRDHVRGESDRREHSREYEKRDQRNDRGEERRRSDHGHRKEDDRRGDKGGSRRETAKPQSKSYRPSQGNVSTLQGQGGGSDSHQTLGIQNMNQSSQLQGLPMSSVNYPKLQTQLSTNPSFFSPPNVQLSNTGVGLDHSLPPLLNLPQQNPALPPDLSLPHQQRMPLLGNQSNFLIQQQSNNPLQQQQQLQLQQQQQQLQLQQQQLHQQQALQQQLSQQPMPMQQLSHPNQQLQVNHGMHQAVYQTGIQTLNPNVQASIPSVQVFPAPSSQQQAVLTTNTLTTSQGQFLMPQSHPSVSINYKSEQNIPGQAVTGGAFIAGTTQQAVRGVVGHVGHASGNKGMVGKVSGGQGSSERGRGHYGGQSGSSQGGGHMSHSSNIHDRSLDKGSILDDLDDDDAGELLCTKCDKVFMSDQVMRKHARWHDLMENGVSDLRCDNCEQAFYSHSSLKNHISLKHTLNSWNCLVCDITFPNSNTLLKHLQVNKHRSVTNKFCCSLCAASFRNIKQLIVHKDGVHTDKYAFKPQPLNIRRY